MFNHLVLAIIIFVSIVLTVRTGKLTAIAAIMGGCIGALLFICAGFTGIAMMAMFFILATAATIWKKEKKKVFGIAEDNEGRRDAGQVLANAGVAGVLGICILFFPSHSNTFRLMIAAAFSSATADTLSSELGNVYGQRFYNIISFKTEKRGLNGVVSIEGTLFGIAGSIIIAVVHAIGFGLNLNFLWIVIAGTTGNLADSILGATVERKRYLSNNAVNFLNTAIGALTALILGVFF